MCKNSFQMFIAHVSRLYGFFILKIKVMHIEDLISKLTYEISKGNNYVNIRGLGTEGLIIETSKDEIPPKYFYVLSIDEETIIQNRITNLVENKHFKFIKCKLKDFDFEDDWNDFSLMVKAEPIEDLPKWYDKKNYADDFENGTSGNLMLSREEHKFMVSDLVSGLLGCEESALTIKFLD